jgi:hypothetical protein
MSLAAVAAGASRLKNLLTGFQLRRSSRLGEGGLQGERE